ncbi:unnamed protein product [Didymodactylos carnosus]|uniref:DDE Tnp4 domain-containing protein n=1 Tax=Didymodactylos carnosus TaxID=1234261 RepID=A0A815YXI0_9BILA|nr:unnamed protein product [Didymodactylos carnosus]CAF4440978.1 unnamed protein product [Didymodactylos carnosus]
MKHSGKNGIEQHIFQICKEIMVNTKDQACVIMDGTYIYCQKFANNKVQKALYSNHKKRHLVKPMLIVASDGYILSILGPFMVDGKNNAASIITHCFFNNYDDILPWFKDDDIIKLDRGFRDAVNTMKYLGFNVAMPYFLYRNSQFTAEEANLSRCVTKWKRVEVKMLKLLHVDNELKHYLDGNKFMLKWNKHDVKHVVFPQLTEDDLRGITCSRVIGCCFHITAVLWHLGVNQAATDLPIHPLSSQHYFNKIHNSLKYQDFESIGADDTDVKYSLANSDNDSDD